MKLSKISIVIPVFNEKETIIEVLRRVEKAKINQIEKEIIIVDDGSSDGTQRILKKIENKEKYKVYYHSKNKGKGAALKTGFLKTSGEAVIVQDADLEYNPEDYPLLLAPFLKDNADAVYGSRFLTGLPRRIIYFWHQIGNRWLTFLSNAATGLNLSDMETGFKAFRGDLIREIAPTLKSSRFGFEPEITAKIAKIPDIKIYEVGISYWGRTYK
ncbi:glycosyltransferase family 2 protein [Candidatus Shapirobacteria bacterium]|nr:glycosyltransferase family 2 protein [Candidatus Shapirobacteria bacterium]